MRQGNPNKRMRGRNNNGNGGGRKGPNPLSRNYESNGPDIKVRGTALHIAEKYVSLARDAQAAGDPVLAENYLQHAEHYYRIIAAAQAQLQMPVQIVRQDLPSDDDFDDDLDTAGEASVSRPGEGAQPFVDEMPTPSSLNGDDDTPQRPERAERQERGDRPERGERPPRYERGDRPERGERPPRAERFERDGERGGDRGDRGGERGERFGRERYPRDRRFGNNPGGFAPRGEGDFAGDPAQAPQPAAERPQRDFAPRGDVPGYGEQPRESRPFRDDRRQGRFERRPRRDGEGYGDRYERGDRPERGSRLPDAEDSGVSSLPAFITAPPVVVAPPQPVSQPEPVLAEPVAVAPAEGDDAAPKKRVTRGGRGRGRKAAEAADTPETQAAGEE